MNENWIFLLVMVLFVHSTDVIDWACDKIEKRFKEKKSE